MHHIEKKEDGTYHVDAAVNIYLKSKDCQEGHSYDAMIRIDIMETAELDEEATTGDDFTIEG